MSIKTVLVKSAELIFKIFDSVVQTGTYNAVDDSGFTETTVQHSISILFDSFSAKDVQTLSFSKLIQPTDVKGLVLGSDLTSVSVHMSDVIVVGTDSYSVVAYEVDLAQAMYTFLLRKV